MVDFIYIRCETITWLYNRSNESFSKLDITSFKLYTSRLEREMIELYDNLLELINSSSFEVLEANLMEEMWGLFNDIGSELGYP